MKYCTLLSLMFFTAYSCRPEANVSPVRNQNIDLNKKWPQSQDTVENIYEHYEAYLPYSLAYSEEQLGVRQGGKWGVVDGENRLHFPFEYDTIVSNFSNIALRKDGAYTVYDSSRQEIAVLKADELRPVMNNFFISRTREGESLVNPNGMTIAGDKFESITGPRDESYFLGKRDSLWKSYDMAGEEITSTGKGSEAARWLNEFSVGLKSYGPLKIGMTAEAVEKGLGWKLTKMYGDEYCSMHSLGNDFLAIRLMFNNEVVGTNTLERIYIEDEEVSTRSGIKIGSSSDEVKKVYGSKIVSEVNKYDESAEDLFYVPTDRRDRNYRLNFLSGKRGVVAYSLGRLPSIQFVEGCL